MRKLLIRSALAVAVLVAGGVATLLWFEHATARAYDEALAALRAGALPVRLDEVEAWLDREHPRSTRPEGDTGQLLDTARRLQELEETIDELVSRPDDGFATLEDWDGVVVQISDPARARIRDRGALLEQLRSLLAPPPGGTPRAFRLPRSLAGDVATTVDRASEPMVLFAALRVVRLALRIAVEDDAHDEALEHLRTLGRLADALREMPYTMPFVLRLGTAEMWSDEARLVAAAVEGTAATPEAFEAIASTSPSLPQTAYVDAVVGETAYVLAVLDQLWSDALGPGVGDQLMQATGLAAVFARRDAVLIAELGASIARVRGGPLHDVTHAAMRAKERVLEDAGPFAKLLVPSHLGLWEATLSVRRSLAVTDAGLAARARRARTGDWPTGDRPAADDGAGTVPDERPELRVGDDGALTVRVEELVVGAPTPDDPVEPLVLEAEEWTLRGR